MTITKRSKSRRKLRRRTVQISRLLATAAAREGRRNGRSQEQQLTLWVKLGQAAEASLSGVSLMQLLKDRRIAKGKSWKGSKRAKK